MHISNIFGREEFRKLSHVSAKAAGVISGLGLKGYELALNYFVEKYIDFKLMGTIFPVEDGSKGIVFY